MKITVSIINGQLVVSVDGGSFDEAKAVIEAATDALAAAGVELAATTDIERHRHDPVPVNQNA